MPWFIWLIIAVVALVGETVTTALVLLYVGIAAAITALLAAVGLPFIWQLIIFVPLTFALLSAVRPRTLAMIGGPRPRMRLTGHANLVDRSAMVEQEVSDHGGLVRLGAGEFWTARAYPPGVVLPKGTRVQVMFVDGLTVFVSMPTDSGRLPDLPPDVSSPEVDGSV